MVMLDIGEVIGVTTKRFREVVALHGGLEAI